MPSKFTKVGKDPVSQRRRDNDWCR